MGYTTDFSGSFRLNKKLDKETLEFLTKFAQTRRMKRDRAMLKAHFGKDFGVDGEFYVYGDGQFGQGNGGFVVDHNRPPRTQPSLWCQWTPNEDGTEIAWDEGEKFYSYVAWIEYIIEKILEPRGYSLTGNVNWTGEDSNDIGVISIVENKVTIHTGTHRVYAGPKAKKYLGRGEHSVRELESMVEAQIEELIVLKGE
jgi:hypothetical protein